MPFFSRFILGGISRHIRNRIVTGLLLLVPVVITYLILRFLFDNLDDLLQPTIQQGLGREIRGAGIIAMILVIYLVGLLGTNILGSRIIRSGEWVVMHIPFVRSVYSTSKQLMLFLAGTQNTGFQRVVTVEFPRPGVWSIAFLTGMTSDEQDRPMAVVYIPTAPMPNSGYVNIISVDQVYELNISIQEAMQMVLSGGINSPKQFHKAPLLPRSEDSSVSRQSPK